MEPGVAGRGLTPGAGPAAASLAAPEAGGVEGEADRSAGCWGWGPAVPVWFAGASRFDPSGLLFVSGARSLPFSSGSPFN